MTYGAADTNAYAISEAADRTAPAITVDSLLEQQGGREIDLLKMDIEGAEREVLTGGAAWASSVKHILVETHPPYSSEECLRDLRQLGFDADVDERHPAGVAGSRVL